MGAGLAAEAQLIVAACAAGVPVPHIHHVLSAADGIGEGFVMQRLAGETLGRRIVRDERFAAARRVLARQCGEALARIHAIPTPGCHRCASAVRRPNSSSSSACIAATAPHARCSRSPSSGCAGTRRTRWRNRCWCTAIFATAT